MSSPKMARMFGFFAPVVWAIAGAIPTASTKLQIASGPGIDFRVVRAKSIGFSFRQLAPTRVSPAQALTMTSLRVCIHVFFRSFRTPRIVQDQPTRFESLRTRGSVLINALAPPISLTGYSFTVRKGRPAPSGGELLTCRRVKSGGGLTQFKLRSMSFLRSRTLPLHLQAC